METLIPGTGNRPETAWEINCISAEYAAAYLPLYARYVSGEWYSYIVPLIRKYYNRNTEMADDPGY